MMAKRARQMRILSILKERKIETQNDLVNALRSEGINVTQATVSRDIKELGLVKISNENGGYRYTESSTVQKRGISEQLLNTLRSSVTRVRRSECMVVIDTLPATAQTVAEALDALAWEDVLGTLAGERTVFAVVKPVDRAPRVVNRILELCGYPALSEE